ncbi:MAG: phosphonopyruvate decarboxylase [Deltaproteobacteria bacterium]|nr:phosphonopyruvate decarboxylase [Deltaproteobacteria bacterium]
MIAADAFLQPARKRGYSFYTGVPCSFLTPLINQVISDPALAYVGAASEGEAVAVAAGAWLAGRRTIVMCQNSGLGNTVNPLTSLNHPFRIPTLLIVTWRGQPGLKDEPQHALMGEVTGSLLETIAIGHTGFPKETEAVSSAFDRAERAMEADELPFALIMEKGSVRDDGLDQPDQPIRPRGTIENLRQGNERPARIDLLRCVQTLVPAEAAVIATTGKTGRELFTLEDRPQQLYQVGSMGCASAMGLGIALNSTRPVLVLDGDGAALMKLGTMATIGAYAPGNLIHVVLDNGVHDSTGGQATVAPNVDFAAVAQACGYPRAYRCNTEVGFTRALEAAITDDPSPVLIDAKIAPGSLAELGRPTISPRDVARRFRTFITG